MGRVDGFIALRIKMLLSSILAIHPSCGLRKHSMMVLSVIFVPPLKKQHQVYSIEILKMD